jgi:hypothetical protein
MVGRNDGKALFGEVLDQKAANRACRARYQNSRDVLSEILAQRILGGL